MICEQDFLTNRKGAEDAKEEREERTQKKFTTDLAFLGGPAGMLGGIAVLGLTGLIADALTKVGLEDLLTAIYCQRRLSEPHGKLLDEIEALSLFDGDVKERLKLTVTDGCGCSGASGANISDITREARAILEAVPGMTPAHHRDFNSSNPIMRLRDGTAVRTWKNPLGVDHIYNRNLLVLIVVELLLSGIKCQEFLVLMVPWMLIIFLMFLI